MSQFRFNFMSIKDSNVNMSIKDQFLILKCHQRACLVMFIWPNACSHLKLAAHHKTLVIWFKDPTVSLSCPALILSISCRPPLNRNFMANLMASLLRLNRPPRKRGQKALSCLFFHKMSNMPLIDSFIMSSVSFIEANRSSGFHLESRLFRICLEFNTLPYHDINYM